MAYTKYSLTPANNNAAPPDGAPEGMLPSAVNDTMRDMMAQIRDCGDGIRGGTYTMTAPVITGGSINGAAIGASSASTGAFTTLAYSSTLTGGTGVVNLGSGQFYKDASGNVGLGTTSPGMLLDLQKNGASNYNLLRLGNTDAGGAGTNMIFTGNGNTAARIKSYYNSAWALSLGTDSYLDTVYIASGNVGIGTTSGSARLSINGGASTSQMRFEVNNATYTQEVSTNAAVNAYVYKSTDALYHVWKNSNSEVMRLDTNGRITVPSQTGFRATKISNTQSISAGAWTRVSFNSTTSPTGSFNTGNAYSTSTNRFTAPVTGKYLFTASVNINAATAGQMYIDFGLNGSNNIAMESSVAYPVGDTSLATSTIISMAANDTMEVDLFTTTATTAGNRTCGFSGQLLS